MWFPILCGIALVLGVAWLWIPRADITGDRTAELVVGQDTLPPKQIAASLADTKPGIRERVIDYFARNSEWLRSSHAEVEFSAANESLILRIAAGRQTRLVRFRIDQGLREWYDENGQQLDTEHKARLSESLSQFMDAWDVAIRNQTGVEKFMQFRDSVGLAGCVYGLGDNISARIDGKLYPCVYEDDNSVYFLLPRSASTFHVVGYRANGDASNFPGEYRVTIQTPAPPDEQAD